MITDDMYIIEEEYIAGSKIDTSGSAAAKNIGAKNKDQIGIVSGDIIDAEMKHRLETLDKQQVQAILESKDIVKAYNDFVDLKIEDYKSKGEDSESLRIVKSFASCFNDFYQFANSQVTGKSVEQLKHDVKDGFTYQTQDPQFIRQLLQTRLKYAECTERLLKQVIENNAKVLKISSAQLETMIKGSSPQNIKDMKDQIEKNKDQFVKNKYLADCRPIGGGILVCGEGFEIGGENTKFEDSIQDLLHYDVVVRAHGTSSELSERADARASKKIKEGLHKSKLLKLGRIKEKEIDDTVDEIFNYLKTKGQWPLEDYKSEPRKMAVLMFMQKWFKKSLQDEKDHARWEFAKPITFVDGKSYVSVVKFVRACKDQGFKKIKMYQCNPGEYDLPESLKPGVVFTQRTNYIESTIIKDYEVAENIALEGVYQLEQLALQLCDENGIDYTDDTYLTECMNYFEDNKEFIAEGLISDALHKLVELCRTIIGAIVGFIKKIAQGIAGLIQRIAEYMKNKDKRQVKKDVEVTTVSLEAAKLRKSKVHSQDELYKVVETDLNNAAKEYRKVASKQAQINKQLQQQLETAAKREGKNESTILYPGGNVFEDIMNDLF